MIPAEQPLEENRFTRFAKARLDSFLSARSVLTAVQPMVDLESSDLVGHELLARPRNTGGSQTARSLLQIAESQGLAAELSRRLRAEGLAKTAHRVVPGRLFLNTHPAELERPHDTGRLATRARRDLSRSRADGRDPRAGAAGSRCLCRVAPSTPISGHRRRLRRLRHGSLAASRAGRGTA